MNLRDDFVIRGTDFNQFVSQVKKFTDESRVIPVNGWEIGLFSFFEKDASGNYAFYQVDEGTLNEQKRHIRDGRHILHLKAKEVNQELINELMSPGHPGLLLYVGNASYYFSAGAIGTLAQRAGIGCSWLNEKSIFKAETLVEGLCRNDRICNIVVHSDQAFKPNGDECKIEKVFSVMGSHYNPVPMTVVSDAAKKVLEGCKVGKAVIKGWEISHRFTRIAIEFPGEAEEAQKAYGLPDAMIPGVIIQNSDTGDCSITAYGTFRVHNSVYPVIYDEALSKAHIVPKKGETEENTMSAEFLVQQIDENLLKNLRVLPEALARKAATPVYDFDPDNIEIPADRRARPVEYKENLRAVSALIKKWAKDLQLVGVIGKKRTKELVDEMVKEIDPAQVYTEYDIAMNFMTLSDRISGISQALRDGIAKKCKDAPFLKGLKQAENKKIVLTPEL